MRAERFSVCAFFVDGSNAYVEPRFVAAAEAMRLALACIRSISARVGITQRVIIVDGGDNTCFEWEHGRGVIFPRR